MGLLEKYKDHKIFKDGNSKLLGYKKLLKRKRKIANLKKTMKSKRKRKQYYKLIVNI